MLKQNYLNLILSGAALSGILLGAYWLNQPEAVAPQNGTCQLHHSDCRFEIAGRVGQISIFPRPVPIEEPLAITLQLPEGNRLLSGYIEGINMYMGKIPVIVEQAEGQTVRVVSFLGSCSEPQMQWRLVLQLQDANEKKVTQSWAFITRL